MIALAFLMAAAAQPAAAETPPTPPPVAALLAAARSGDIPAARATLSEDVVIMDERGGEPAASTIQAFVEAMRRCEPSIFSMGRDEDDPERSALTISWICPSAPRSESLVWTHGPRIVWIQFGMPAFE